MRITANQTATTPTQTYTAVKPAGKMDPLHSSGSVVSTVSSAERRANGLALEASPPAAKPARDSSWLELTVCRDFSRGQQGCPKLAEECRFAHPDPSIVVKDGVVTCCYDFLKDRCQRHSCKYFHPPAHIKQRLVAAGKQFGAMMSSVYVPPGSAYPVVPMPMAMPTAPLPPSSFVMGGPVLATPSSPGFLTSPPPGFIPSAVMTQFGMMTDRLFVCPEFALGRCTVQLCPLVHPEPHVRRNPDGTVTLCRDFARGGCVRESCRYFHSPPHITAQLETMAGVPQGMFIAPAMPPNFPPMMFPGPIAMAPTQPVPTSMVPIFPGVYMSSPGQFTQPTGAVPLPMSVASGVSLGPAGSVPMMSSVPLMIPRVATPPSPISVISGQTTLLEDPSIISSTPATATVQQPDIPQAQPQAIWIPAVQTIPQ